MAVTIKSLEKFQLRHLTILLASLILPALALLRMTEFVRWEYLASGAVALSVFSFVLTGVDKKRATTGAWRIPENHLHLLELLGGWPGSYLGQRFFWHKVSKASYQTTFWLIVAAFQYASLDYLLNWRMSQAIAGYVGQLMKS